MLTPVLTPRAARTLAMLLRCGMICKEELEIVLDMIDIPGARPRFQIAGSRR